jgi:hypothetical protein
VSLLVSATATWIIYLTRVRMGAPREEIAAEAMKASDAWERAQKQIAELEALTNVRELPHFHLFAANVCRFSSKL